VPLCLERTRAYARYLGVTPRSERRTVYGLIAQKRNSRRTDARVSRGPLVPGSFRSVVRAIINYNVHLTRVPRDRERAGRAVSPFVGMEIRFPRNPNAEAFSFHAPVGAESSSTRPKRPLLPSANAQFDFSERVPMTGNPHCAIVRLRQCGLMRFIPQPEGAFVSALRARYAAAGSLEIASSE